MPMACFYIRLIVCLIDECFVNLMSYYCYGIHTPPRCDIGELFLFPKVLPNRPPSQPDRHDLRPNNHNLRFLCLRL